jgi:hypothetical protein
VIIRSSQLQQISDRNVEEFQTFMIRFLKEEFPEESAALSDDELREAIQRHTDEARPYAIEDENALAKFIYLKWLLGEDFEDLPDRAWLMGLLEDRARPAIERMDVAIAGVERQLENETSEPAS